MAAIKRQNQKVTRIGKNGEKLECSSLLVGIQTGEAAVENSVAIPSKWNIDSLNVPAMPHQGVSLKALKAGS